MKKAVYTDLAKKMFDILAIEKKLSDRCIVEINEARHLINLLAVSDLGIGTAIHGNDYKIVKMDDKVHVVSDMDVLLSFYESKSLIKESIKEKFPEILDLLGIKGIIKS